MGSCSSAASLNSWGAHPPRAPHAPPAPSVVVGVGGAGGRGGRRRRDIGTGINTITMTTVQTTTSITDRTTSIGTTIATVAATTPSIVTPTFDIATGITTAGAANGVLVTLKVAVSAIVPVAVVLPSCLRRIFSQGAILAKPTVGFAPWQYRPGRVCGHFRLHGKPSAAGKTDMVCLVHPFSSSEILVLLNSSSPESRRQRRSEVVVTHTHTRQDYI